MTAPAGDQAGATDGANRPMRKTTLPAGLVIAACGALLATSVCAQAAKAPPPAAAASLDLKGFRSAAFGMSPAQVRQAAAKDFGAAAKISEGANPAQGTQVLSVSLDHLDPGPGQVQIAYVFGATSKTLDNVAVTWATPGEATEEQRAAVAAAGEQLVSYFQAQPAPAKASQGPSPTGPNALVLYAALDKKNAGVEVLIEGIAYQAGADKAASPPPKGPAALRILYMLNADKPDVKTIKPGSF
jgi:hypothetical protein